MRLIDSCITQLTAQGPSRTCNESKEEEEVHGVVGVRAMQKKIWSNRVAGGRHVVFDPL